MLPNISHFGTAQIVQVLDHIRQPGFLLDVDGPDRFRFAHINAQHLSETGLDAGLFLGKAPHDVLPERVADTLVANYEQCRASGVAHVYEEQLELGEKTRWWKTTLSPMTCGEHGGDVYQIIGTSLDITDAKNQELNMSSALSAQVAATEGIRAHAANAMLDHQGPMRAVLAWLDILRDGFIDLGDGKLQEMDRVQQLAIDAIVCMDDALHSSGADVQSPRPHVAIDLAHMCRDIAALVDPEGRLNMHLPDNVIEADWAVIQIVLRSLMEQAARRANTAITVSVEQDSRYKIAIVIKDDSACNTRLKHWMVEISTATKIVKERGGDLSMSSSLEEGAVVRVTLPGQIASKADAAPLAPLARRSERHG